MLLKELWFYCEREKHLTEEYDEACLALSSTN